MKRDWPLFLKYSAKSIRYSLYALLPIPFFFIILNPNFSSPSFQEGLVRSLRIGAEIALFYWLLSLLFYGAVYLKSPSGVVKLKKSIRFQLIFGLIGMTLGLLVVSLTEPYVSGKSFGFANASLGWLLGGLTFILSITYIAFKETQAHNLKLKSASLESQLHSLKNQLQPHFLFNSLNSLAELIDANHVMASEMTQKLADLYREILNSSKSDKVALSSELSIARKYLEFESIRFGEKLKFSIFVDSSLLTLQIPSLILQTLVENSVKHQLANSDEVMNLEIRITPEKNLFLVQVINSGCLKLKNAKTGTGIPNTIERLQLHYNDRHRFTLSEVKQNTIASFYISGT